MRKRINFLCILACSFVIFGCSKQVPPGTVGRINTSDGWSPDILKPGYHTCFGRDTMYLLNVTNAAFPEALDILVGGKVNLRVNFTIRVRANASDVEALKKVFENVQATPVEGIYVIDVKNLYTVFLQMKVLAIPRMLFEIQPDVQTAVANSPALAVEFRKQITEIAKSTPLIVEDVQITNYDWPKSITEAQEELMKMKLNTSQSRSQEGRRTAKNRDGK